MTHEPHAWDDPLKCAVGDWIPATASAVRGWDRTKGIYWYLVGGFIRRGRQAAGPVNPTIPWGFEFRTLSAGSLPGWVRCC
jgi:hypothetical protein